MLFMPRGIVYENIGELGGGIGSRNGGEMCCVGCVYARNRHFIKQHVSVAVSIISAF